ncbi:MAG TPA: ABC transporter ATP-binding protein [Usitatibacter sp.]|nr:ABC transporter ATP-binding protein [Usitatibacter sp.]
MNAEAIVRASGLRFAYGGREPVLRGVDLELAKGEVFGVVGADGAGKSTLLSLLIGQLVPDSGSATVLGMPATDTQLRRRIAYMPQGFGQYLDLSIGENLEFFADLHGLARGEAQSLIGDLLARTGLTEFRGRRAGQLSGGMMQKLALACALVSRPQAMFLDEPTTGVDPASRRAFWQLLDQVRAEGVGIVYATANMDEAERCDRVGLLVHGRFERQGTPLDLIREAGGALFEVSGPDARAKRREARGIANVQLVFPVGETLKVWLGDAADEAGLRAEVARLFPGFRVRRLRPTLHDVALRDLALAPHANDGATSAERH